MDDRPEITDNERCQMCIHLGNDRYLYIEAEPNTFPDAQTILQKAEDGKLTDKECEQFRMAEIDYHQLPDDIKQQVIICCGIRAPQNYTTSYYKQLIAEGAFSLGLC